MANEYVSPTGFNDPTSIPGSNVGSWGNELYAYDGDIQSGAVGICPPYSWGNYLELTIDAIYCSKVKFVAKYEGTVGINKIDLDVYYDGDWHDVFEGSFLGRVWVEKSLGATYYVSKMRMRFYNNGSDYRTAVIGEAMFYETVDVPKVTTVAATDVAGGKATLNGDMTDTGGVVPTVRGFEYKEEIDGTVLYAYDTGSFEVGTYSKDLTELDPTKEYYFRAYATNTEGTGYGEWLSLGEAIVIPTVTTSAATSVDHEKAVLNGEITETGGEDCEERGFQWKIGASGDIETLRETGTFGIGTYSLLLDELDANVTYYFRAYAKNAGGTGYGDWLNFTTDYTTPEVITHNATDELETQVTGNGEIVSTGGQDCDERGFEYGLSKVATWLKNEVAGGYGVGFFDIVIDSLTANTEYWYRAYAKFLLDLDINQLTTSNYTKSSVQLQVVGDKIYLVWIEQDGTYPQVWTGIMDLDATNFVATKRTTSSVYYKYTPQLQVVGDKIYYVWIENSKEVWTGIMDIDGTNFVATKRETNTESTVDPQFQVVGSTIYYVWLESDGAKTQIWTATMTTAGADWTATKRTTVAENKWEVQFQVVDDTIYFVYTQTLTGNREIWTATMTTGGASWTATKRTTSATGILGPQLEVVGDMIYFIFTQQVGGYSQIFTASMGTDGSSWTATQRTDFGVWTAGQPQLQVVGDVIYYTFIRQLPSGGGGNHHLYSAQMNIDGTNWVQKAVTTTEYPRLSPQFQVVDGVIYYIWTQTTGGYNQIWTFRADIYIGYGEWVKFITAAPGAPGDRPSGYKNDVCSDNSGFTYILNRSLTDDGASYVSHFTLSTDLSGKKTLHTNKRLLDIFSYFINKGSGTAKIYIKCDTEPSWQYAGEISLAGEVEIIIKHLPVDFLAKTFLIKFSFENDFEFVGMITEAVPIGDR